MVADKRKNKALFAALVRQNLLLLLLLALFIGLLFYSNSRISALLDQPCVGDSVVFHRMDAGKEVTLLVELARTPEEWSLGLMHRESLDAGSGMLFVFENEEPLHFWMKNTLIPLDIIFVSGDMRIVSVSKNAQPCVPDDRGRCPLYSSSAAARYVVEANAGFFDAAGLSEGDLLEIRYADEACAAKKAG